MKRGVPSQTPKPARPFFLAFSPLSPNHIRFEPLPDASVEQHHVRPQSCERQHVRGPGGDPERAARVVPTEARARAENATGSVAPPSGEVSMKGKNIGKVQFRIRR